MYIKRSFDYNYILLFFQKSKLQVLEKINNLKKRVLFINIFFYFSVDFKKWIISIALKVPVLRFTVEDCVLIIN